MPPLNRCGAGCTKAALGLSVMRLRGHLDGVKWPQKTYLSLTRPPFWRCTRLVRDVLVLCEFPLSVEFTDPDTGMTVQYFERAVFEYHPSIRRHHPIHARLFGTEPATPSIGHEVAVGRAGHGRPSAGRRSPVPLDFETTAPADGEA